MTEFGIIVWKNTIPKEAYFGTRRGIIRNLIYICTMIQFRINLQTRIKVTNDSQEGCKVHQTLAKQVCKELVHAKASIDGYNVLG